MTVPQQLAALALALTATFTHAICRDGNNGPDCNNAQNDTGAKAQAAGGKANADTKTVVDNGSGRFSLGVNKAAGDKQATKIPDSLPAYCFRGATAETESVLSGVVYDKAETTIKIDQSCQMIFDALVKQAKSCANANAAVDLGVRQTKIDPKADRQGQISAMAYQRWLTGCFSQDVAIEYMNIDTTGPIPLSGFTPKPPSASASAPVPKQ